MIPVRLRSLLLALCLAGCSGSDGAGQAPAPVAGEAPAEQPPPSAGAKLRAAQDSSVEALCERLVDCAVQAASASMSPEEVAKLDVEKTAPRLRDECEADGAKSALSPRQIKIVQRCVNTAETCDELHTCLEEAKKK